MASGDVTFKTLYFGPTSAVNIDAATIAGAAVGTDNNKTILGINVSNGQLLIVQVVIATA